MQLSERHAYFRLLRDVVGRLFSWFPLCQSGVNVPVMPLIFDRARAQREIRANHKTVPIL